MFRIPGNSVEPRDPNQDRFILEVYHVRQPVPFGKWHSGTVFQGLGTKMAEVGWDWVGVPYFM